MSEKLIIEFVDSGRSSGQPSGGSPTSARFAGGGAGSKPESSLPSPAEKVADKQQRNQGPSRGFVLPVSQAALAGAGLAGVPTPISTAGSSAAIAPPVIPLATGAAAAKAAPAKAASFAGIAAPIGIASLAAKVPSAAAISGALGAAAPIAAGVGAALLGAKLASDSVTNTTERIAEFSPDISRSRARQEALDDLQSIDHAKRVGPELSKIEATKSAFNRFKKEVVTTLQEFAFDTAEAGVDFAGKSLAATAEAAGIATQEQVLQTLKRIDERLESLVGLGEDLQTPLLQEHLPAPEFDGTPFSSSNDPNMVPPGLEMR